MLRLLGDAGCNLSAATPQGVTPAHLAARAGSLDLLKYLFVSGAETDQPDADGETPLLVAIRNTEAPRYFVAWGKSRES